MLFSIGQRSLQRFSYRFALILIYEIIGNFHVFAETETLSISSNRGTYFARFDGKGALTEHIIEKSNVSSFTECGLKCLRMQPECKSFNYIQISRERVSSCEINDKTKSCTPQQDFIEQPDSEYFESVDSSLDETCSVCENGGKFEATAMSGFKCICKNGFEGELCQAPMPRVCFTTSEPQPLTLSTLLGGTLVEVYCDAREAKGGWTLVARFSNTDDRNWMEDNGTWWYDRLEPYGNTLDPSDNADMISDAFWLQQGSEFKITKSDDATHTALLSTTGNCLNGMTFRAKMKSYGVFRNTDNWAVDRCLGSCPVVYGGDYKTVKGFGQSQCDDVVQTRNNIGFWCDYGFDGSVMMIGGGGDDCSRADHGIGVTEENMACFKGGAPEIDFEDNALLVFEKSYALNLWIR